MMPTTRRGTHPVPDANPVRPHHLIRMAERYAQATQERAWAVDDHGTRSEPYAQTTRALNRLRAAMWRLAEALERQSGGTR